MKSGYFERHAESCPAPDGGPCTCTPTRYRGIYKDKVIEITPEIERRVLSERRASVQDENRALMVENAAFEKLITSLEVENAQLREELSARDGANPCVPYIRELQSTIRQLQRLITVMSPGPPATLQ